MALSKDDLAALARGLAPILRELTDPLKARIATLEQRKGMQFVGPWSHVTVYDVNDVVLRASAVWVCRKWNAGRMPGTSDTAEYWALMVKSPPHKSGDAR